MKLHTVDTGYFKLDGGAMFGVVPKTMWQKLNPPDERNLCTWQMRCLLIEDGKQLILIDRKLQRLTQHCTSLKKATEPRRNTVKKNNARNTQLSDSNWKTMLRR